MRTYLAPALFNSKVNELKRHVPRMQTSNQFLNFSKLFTVGYQQDPRDGIQEIKYCSKDFSKQATLQQRLSVVNSFLPRKRGQNRENAASQRVLGLCFLEQRPRPLICYCNACFPISTICNLQQRRKIHLVPKTQQKPSPSPATAPKICSKGGNGLSKSSE